MQRFLEHERKGAAWEREHGQAHRDFLNDINSW